jgi:hypothetical protein
LSAAASAQRQAGGHARQHEEEGRAPRVEKGDDIVEPATEHTFYVKNVSKTSKTAAL